MNRQRAIHSAAACALVLAAFVGGLARARAEASPASKVFAALDANHDQAVSAAEFEAGYAGLQRALALGMRLREQFTAMDADKSGALEEREYAQLVLIKQAGKAAPALASFDANGDRKLGFAEYVTLVQKLAAPAAAPAQAGR